MPEFLTDNFATAGTFLENVLGNAISTIPKGAQWIVRFDDLEQGILPAIELAYEREPKAWNTASAAKKVITDIYQSTYGCLFCQAIDIQGEGANVSAGGNLQQSNYLRSYVGGGRQDLSIMRMSFLDSNISFCDTFLRGWALATSCFGMIARKGEKQYRTTVTCWKIGISPKGPFALQTVTFEGVCCINVSNEEYNYDPVTAFTRREAKFAYNNYSVDSVEGNILVSEK